MADENETGNLLAAAIQDLRIHHLEDVEAFHREEPADENTLEESTTVQRRPLKLEFWQSIHFPPDDRSDSFSDGEWMGSQAGYGPPGWSDDSQEYPIYAHYSDHLQNCVRAVQSWTTILEDPVVICTPSAFKDELKDTVFTDTAPVVQESASHGSPNQRHAVMKPSASKIRHVFMHPGLYRELEPIISVQELADILLDNGAHTSCNRRNAATTSRSWKIAAEKVKRNEHVQWALLDLRESGIDALESIVEGRFDALVNAMKRQLGVRIKTRCGLKYGVGGILAAENLAIHGITDSTFEDLNGSILLVTEAKSTKSFPAEALWYRQSRGVQTIGAVMSSPARYHSEIDSGDGLERRHQNGSDEEARVEGHGSEIDSGTHTEEDNRSSRRVAVKAPVILFTQDRFKIFVATRHVGVSQFGISTYPPGYEMGEIPLTTSYSSCSCTQDSCGTCKEQRRDFLEVLTLCLSQEIPACSIPREIPAGRPDVISSARSQNENLPSAEIPFHDKTQNLHRPFKSVKAENWKGDEPFVIKLGSTWRVIWFMDPENINAVIDESTNDNSDGSVSDSCIL
jgi:hypothetical protein